MEWTVSEGFLLFQLYSQLNIAYSVLEPHFSSSLEHCKYMTRIDNSQTSVNQNIAINDMYSLSKLRHEEKE